MKIIHRYIKSDSELNTIKNIKEILNSFSIKYKYEEDTSSEIPSFKYFIEFYLYEDHRDFLIIKSKLRGIITEQYIGIEYEKNDFQNADWFIMSTGQYQYPQPEDNYLDLTFDTSNHCEICGIGKIQNNPFRLKNLPKQRRNQLWGLHWEFESLFIRNEAKRIIEKEKINGIEFSKTVLHKKNVPIDDFYQLHINKTLRSGFKNYNSKMITCKLNNEEQCNNDNKLEYCGKIKYHHPIAGGYLFQREIFKEKFDLALTYEYFGSGGNANRLIVCSKNFKNIIEKNKLNGLEFIPIIHEKIKRDPAYNKV